MSKDRSTVHIDRKLLYEIKLFAVKRKLKVKTVVEEFLRYGMEMPQAFFPKKKP